MARRYSKTRSALSPCRPLHRPAPGLSSPRRPRRRSGRLRTSRGLPLSSRVGHVRMAERWQSKLDCLCAAQRAEQLESQAVALLIERRTRVELQRAHRPEKPSASPCSQSTGLMRLPGSGRSMSGGSRVFRHPSHSAHHLRLTRVAPGDLVQFLGYGGASPKSRGSERVPASPERGGLEGALARRAAACRSRFAGLDDGR